MPCYNHDRAVPTGAPILSDRDFALPGDQPHYVPDRPVDVRHVALDLVVDFAQRRLSGTCATTMSVLYAEIRSVTLQAAEMEIANVTFTGENGTQSAASDWDYDGEHLTISLDTPLRYGSEFTVTVSYATTPRIGMNFVGPSAGDPDMASQAYTQGQPEHAHYWFPCVDSTNERATMAIAARVPSNCFAIANGQLDKIEEHPDSDEHTFFYHQSFPLSAYLATLAVGEFTELRDTFGETLVQYLVRPGFEAHVQRMMGDTPAMLAYYSERFGIRYPYEKYSQVVVEQYTSGAMENTSATTHTWLLLPDERYFPDWGGKATVAHELVHQWFGDLLTCRDWSHGWLNEGFATYFEETWKQADPTAGELEFRLGMRDNQKIYLAEDRSYRRPIVYNVYETDGGELFDRHLYEKGGCVLHMLRYVVGEDAFWRGLQHYARTNTGREVITADLERAFEEATGKSLGRFFAQWVYHGGHPEFDVSYEWDNDRHFAKVTIKQTQKLDDLTPLFTTPLDLAFTFKQHGEQETKTVTVTVTQEAETFVIPLDRRPLLVRVDPYGWVLKTTKFERPVTMLRWQLANDSDPLGRLEAAEGLAKHNDPQTVAALVAALNGDDFWAVRAEAATALGRIADATSLAALIAAIDTVDHAKARRAVVAALGRFHAPERLAEAEQVAAALRKLLERGDVSYMVEHEAAASLGKTRTAGAYAALVAVTGGATWQHLVEKGALLGLGELGTPEAATFLANWVQDRTKPLLTREGAALALGTLIRTERLEASSTAHIVVRDALTIAISDPWIRVRVFAAQALRQLDDESVIPALTTQIAREYETRPRRTMRMAVLALRAGKKGSTDLRRVRRDLDELREENRKLRDRLTIIEATSKQPNATSDEQANGKADEVATTPISE